MLTILLTYRRAAVGWPHRRRRATVARRLSINRAKSPLSLPRIRVQLLHPLLRRPAHFSISKTLILAQIQVPFKARARAHAPHRLCCLSERNLYLSLARTCPTFPLKNPIPFKKHMDRRLWKGRLEFIGR